MCPGMEFFILILFKNKCFLNLETSIFDNLEKFLVTNLWMLPAPIPIVFFHTPIRYTLDISYFSFI